MLKITLQGTFLWTIIINIFFKGALSMILSMIRTLVLIAHMPMLRVIFPANVIVLFSIIIPFVTFDILEDLGVVEMIYTRNSLEIEEKYS